jgi:hypothetical protein
MASMFLAQAGAKLFHKNIPGYALPDPVYETYMDKDGEEKTRKVWPDLLRLHPRLAEQGFVAPERYPCRLVQAGHPDLAERQEQGPQA